MEIIERIIDYQFKNKNLLDLALTHASYAHKFGIKNNERLEFLGDSILGFIVADFLVKNFEDNEGVLTKLTQKRVNPKRTKHTAFTALVVVSLSYRCRVVVVFGAGLILFAYGGIKCISGVVVGSTFVSSLYHHISNSVFALV